MRKQEYIRAVSPFIDYLVKAWDGEFNHAYEIRDRSWRKYRQGKQHWEVTNLREAFEQYWWDGNCEQAIQKLDEYRSLWKVAEARGDQMAGRQVILRIFQWGGVLNEHTKRSVDKTSDIFEHIRGAIHSLKTGDTSAFHRSGFFMNSAYTKVYAVIDDRFIIYDGRVGAALGLLARKFLPIMDNIGQHNAMVPLLAFPFKKERTSTGKYIRAEDSTRNPSNGYYKFREVGDDADHAKWVLRSSWIIEELLLRLKQPGMTSRKVEAALFMVGYHVSVPK